MLALFWDACGFCLFVFCISDFFACRQIYVPCVSPEGVRRRYWISWKELTRCCEQPWGCQELNRVFCKRPPWSLFCTLSTHFSIVSPFQGLATSWKTEIYCHRYVLLLSLLKWEASCGKMENFWMNFLDQSYRTYSYRQ